MFNANFISWSEKKILNKFPIETTRPFLYIKQSAQMYTQYQCWFLHGSNPKNNNVKNVKKYLLSYYSSREVKSDSHNIAGKGRNSNKNETS